jgi:outer membrane protein TolC
MGVSLQRGPAEPRRVDTICVAARRPLPCFLLFLLALVCYSSSAFADELHLRPLIDEALRNNHEILLSGSRAAAARHRIPQAASLPDPMFMFGYQNEGFSQYTYGKSSDAQWMFSASQMFPFPGKRSLKEEMAARETDSLESSLAHIRFKTVERIRELFYDLFLAHKTLDLVRERGSLFSRIEDAAVARYSTGTGSQQEVLMAQTEKYVLLEKEEMLKQKIRSTEAMLNAAVGRDVNSPLGRPAEPVFIPYTRTMSDLLTMHVEHSPLIKSRENMVSAAEAKVRMAKREYYPDFTVNAGYYSRRGEFDDMWSLTTTMNIPLYYKTRQRQAVYEAEASLSEARHELEGTKVMLTATIRDNYSMIQTAERLMELYKNALIPKTYQDFELALSGYAAGKADAQIVISRLTSLLGFEMLYWGQRAEREKAVARLDAAVGLADPGGDRR